MIDRRQAAWTAAGALAGACTRGVFSVLQTNPSLEKPLSVYHFPRLSERLSPEDAASYRKALEILNDRTVGDAARNEARKVELACFRRDGERSQQFARQNAVPVDEQQRLIAKFGYVVQQTAAHERLDVVQGLEGAEGQARYTRAGFNTDPNFRFLVPWGDWMNKFSCDWYAFFVMRREDPASFVGPLGEKEPIGLLLAQRYTLVHRSEAQDNDLVMYVSRDKSIEATHFGVVRNGAIVSKNLFSGVAHHSYDLGTIPGQIALTFRKAFDSSAPVPDLDGITDWCEVGVCITRSSQSSLLQGF